jgi:hypothetical protein
MYAGSPANVAICTPARGSWRGCVTALSRLDVSPAPRAPSVTGAQWRRTMRGGRIGPPPAERLENPIAESHQYQSCLRREHA